jgi:serine/threonine protein kinase
MSESVHSVAAPAEVDRLAAEVVAEITDRLHAGERVDVEAYIARHPELADRLRRLLPALAILNGFGSSADPDGPAAGPGEEMRGTLGDFRLIREVGRGGMGIVYEAEQISLNRRVALKVLPFAATMDPRLLQRFHIEARAAAGLHHTNSVPVYAVGQERGVHYYAMQFIDGRTLAQLIAEQRGEGLAQVPTMREGETAAATTSPPAAQATSAAPRDAAYFRRVAEWGIQAAALDCAHTLGIVHRDVKPANLMVNAAGRLWVTDFGLAQVQSDVRLTMAGDLVGTLRYMSPEQALAKHGLVDHRADVYSLAATLYELLTLQPAFSGNDREELLHQVAYEEPRPPRRVNRAIPAELETIILKALEKNPAERYATAQQLADDLRRFLEDKPIRATRPSLVRRARQWGRRHQAVVWSAGVAVVLLLLLGAATLLVSNALISREMKEKEYALEAARASEKAAQAQQQLARQNLRKACDAVEQMLTRIAEERLFHEPRLTPVRRRLLEDAARFYEEFVRQGGNEPWVRAEAARAYRGLAYVRLQMGQWDRAAESSRHAIDLLEQLRAEDPAECDRYGLSLAYHHLGAALQHQGRLREAEEACRSAIALAAELVSEAPGDARYRIHLAYFQNEQGETLLSVRRLREAEEAFLQALGLAEKLAVDFPADPRSRRILVWCRAKLGNFLATAGRHREAEKVLREALETYRKLRPESPFATDVDAETAGTLVSLAYVLRATGRLPEAQELCLQALPLIENYVVDFPELVGPRETHMSAWTSLVALLDATGNREEADRLYQRTGAVLERLVADSPAIPEYRRELAALRHGRASSLHWTSPKEAEQLQRQALALAEQLAHDAPDVPANQCLLVDCRQLLAYMLARTGRHVEAEDLCQRTLPLAQRLAAEFPADPEPARRLTDLQRTCGMVLRDTARPREAEDAFRRAAEAAEKLAADFPDTPAYRLQSAFVYGDLMELRENASRAREVEDAYRRGVEHLQKGAADFPTETAFAEHLSHCHRKWAYFLLNNDRLPQAEEALNRAVQGLDKLLAGLPPAARPDLRALLGDTYVCLACVLSAAGRRGEAAEAIRKSREFPPPSDAPGCECQAWTLLAVPDASLVDSRRPVELAKKAVELAPEDARCRVALGMAYCRAKEWKTAVEALEKSNELTGTRPGSISGAFCLAIAHWHLGHKEQARSWYDRAVASLAKHPAPNANDRRLRAEAEKLIGVQGPPMK